MLKTLQSGLFAAAIAASFTANAQIIEEHFNTAPWGQSGYSVWTTCESNSINSDPARTIVNTYSGLSVTYTLFKAAVDPACNVKHINAGTGTVTPGTPPISIGYVQVTNQPDAYFQISKLDYVGRVVVNLSWTGGSGRQAVLQKSTDDGVTWTEVVEFDSQGTGNGGTVGNEAIVDASNVMLRFVDAAVPNRFRIHDLFIYNEPLGLSDATLAEQASTVTSANNVITVTSKNGGTAEVLNMNGTVVAHGDFTNSINFNVPQNGLYIVKLVSNNKVSTTKVMVQ
jgi:hypothetical protein